MNSRISHSLLVAACAILCAVAVSADYTQLCGTFEQNSCDDWHFYNVKLTNTLANKNSLGIELVSGPGGTGATPQPGHVLYSGGVCTPTQVDQCLEFGEAGRACGPGFGGFTGSCRRASSNTFVQVGVSGSFDWKIGVNHPTTGVRAQNCTTSTCSYKLSVWLTHADGSTAGCDGLVYTGTDPNDQTTTNPCPPAGTSFAAAPSLTPSIVSAIVTFALVLVLAITG